MANQLQLEQLQIVARPRLHWEALDLGVLIARRWYGLLLASWMSIALVVFAVLWLVIPQHPIWAIVIVWWLKPVYERIPLHILSTAIFGSTPVLRGALRGWRRVIPPGMLRVLTYRRFSPSRSFEAPVWVLEGLSGEVRAKRFAVLQTRTGSGAFWLTVLGVHVEGFLLLGMVTGVYLFIPANMEVDWWGMLLSGSQGQHDWLVNLLTLAVMGAVAPIYVASGFALYLNRRIELEAWDLELGFRKLARRAAEVSGVLLFAACVIVVAPSGYAQSADDGAHWYGTQPPMEELSEPRRQSREAIYAVLEGEDFNQQATVKYPKFIRDWFSREGAGESATEPDMGWLKQWVEVAALAAEVLLWAAVAVLAIWIAHRLRLLQFVGTHLRRRAPPPGEILGLDVSEGSLPEDVAGHAVALWDGGAQREALSLIYRGALVALMHGFACELRASDTEGDCLVKARGVLSPAGMGYFAGVTRAWQRAAYAHALPNRETFAGICEEFHETFARDEVNAERA